MLTLDASCCRDSRGRLTWFVFLHQLVRVSVHQTPSLALQPEGLSDRNSVLGIGRSPSGIRAHRSRQTGQVTSRPTVMLRSR